MQSEIMKNNPWLNLNLKNKNKILEIDQSVITQHNEQYSDNVKKQISEIDYPEPFLGNPESPIYFLLGNPGKSGEEKNDIKTIENGLEEIIEKNLKHDSENLEYPLYFLDPKFKNHSGYNWWNEVFKNLIFDEDKNKNLLKRKTLSKNIFIVELYGYHSESSEKRIITNKERLKSIEYSYFLIDKAIKEKKTIIIARSISTWLEKVEKLKEYNNCYYLGVNRGIKFSISTIPPKPYKLIKSLLTKALATTSFNSK
ncbi:hypothetical protein JM83_1526 [Gillisia sp. Hel_I_86]|uniref:hypothetical protein n=1 Tax=Gillisia sp. Hel_I_86 TaxID=1249981 RepID=UPI001199104E|nr:hypothetical protein [Gillisia sp. Hel_I_86]TVZ26552.1 hypothetical protein JM83_1526 [Gillisia sp. Hel_I_86]